MPCYQVITTSVEFKVGNIEILKKALENLGVQDISVYDNKVGFYKDDRYTIDFNSQKITGRNVDEKELTKFSNVIKRTYSEVVIDELAKKQKWAKKQLGENRYQLQRY
jgi:hypothetical protein